MTEDISKIIPNYSKLSEEDKIKASEMIYRRQMIRSWGFRPGEDPREIARKQREAEGD